MAIQLILLVVLAATEETSATAKSKSLCMSEFIDHNPNGNDDMPEGRFTFEQLTAFFHLKHLYRQDPDMPELAQQALASAKDEVAGLEPVVRQNEKTEEEHWLELFFEDFRDDFIDKRERLIDVQIGVANPDDDPVRLNRYGAQFTEVEQFMIRGIRRAIRENPEADEAEVVREGRITAGETLLEIDRERKARRAHDERLSKLFGPNDGFLLRHVLNGDIEDLGAA